MTEITDCSLQHCLFVYNVTAFFLGSTVLRVKYRTYLRLINALRISSVQWKPMSYILMHWYCRTFEGII